MMNNEQRSKANESSAMTAAEELAQLLDQYLRDLEAGRRPDRAALLANHPELGPRLEEALAGLEYIHGTRKSAAAPAAQLGDFLPIREIGRGGMGVVYEAEQRSLKRRVALKVLSAGAAVDQVAMQRFQREAETVATLHHTNIVPIFAIGCEHGVRYYAMQFIEGRNLAEVAGLGRVEGRQGLDSRQVAQWGLQAAEAIAHAHERGVIHRDIKPSNLILDRDGRIWLTDFGLARRLEDVTLSLTGVLLGTPRYMSPEQAGAAARPIDHRTDIYSLGATLYELVTGRPIFDATTPQAVLTQILTSDPVPPRRITPSLPRDLETIIIKCLLKDPGQRYATARALAEDLRAFLENRAIKARRAGLPVQALRWARKHRRSTTVAGLSAAAVVAVLAGVFLGGRVYWQKHQAGLSLATRDPLLQAEILPLSGMQPIRPAFSLPTRQPVAVPPGSYQVRLSSPGTLSETHRLELKPSQQAEFDVSLQNRALLPPFNVDGAKVELVSLDGPADFVVLRGWDLRRIDAATGNTVWQANLNPYELTNVFRKESDKSAWVMGFDQLLRPAPDLDGDKTGDLVWTSTDPGAAVAFSGKSGRLLWFHPAAVPEEAGAPNAGATIIHRNLAAGVSAVAELDGDGVPDLMLLMTARSVRWVQAVSGKTGRKLWARWLEPRWLKTPTYTNEEILPTPVLAQVDGRQVVCVAASTQLLLLDARDGSVLHAHDLHAVVLQQPRLADLDGNDQPDIVLLCERSAQQRVLIAYSLANRRELWQQPVAAPFEPFTSVTKQVDWPVVADLDHDGKDEIVLPGGSFHTGPRAHMHTDHWSGVQVLSGETGSPRWQHALARGRTPSIMEPVQHFTIGRDLDLDGCDELFVASIYRRSFNSGDTLLCVDALSGKDGHALWSWNLPQHDLHDRVSPITTWSVPGGAPLLAFWSIRSPHTSETAYILDGDTGQLRHLIPGAFQLETADCDGDNIPDLAFRTLPSPELPAPMGRQHVIRGSVERQWSRLAEAQRIRSVAPDVDHDGTEDVLLADPPEMLSGRTGDRLWRAALSANKTVLLASPAGDIDLDRLPDLLAFQEHTQTPNGALPLLSAVSSRTGRTLWTSSAKTRGTGALLFSEAADLQNDGSPDLVVAAELDVTVQRDPIIMPQRSNQVWLMVFDARRGVEKWRQPLTPAVVDRVQIEAMAGAIADLNGDGVRDVLIGALNATNAWELRAHSGKDGSVVWSCALETVFDNFFNLVRKAPAPVVADLDSDGHPEVLLAHDLRLPRPGPNLWFDRRLMVWDGRTGKLRWSHVWQEESDQYRTPIMAVRLGGERGIGVCVVEGRLQRAQLVLLDSQGSEIDRLKVNLRHWPAQVRVADVDSNGVDEILLLNNEGNLVATSAGFRNVLWETPCDSLATILPGEGREPATVIVARFQELIGLSGRAGEFMWKAPASGQRFGSPLWLRTAQRQSPWIVAPGPWPASAPTTGTIVCYGVQQSAGGAAGRTASGHSPATAQDRDPRLARALPWNVLHPGFAPQNAGPLHEFTTREALLGLALLLGLMLTGVVWRRWSWKAGVPFLLCVLLLMAYGIESSRPRHLPPTWFVVVLTRAVLMLPLAAFVAFVVRALAQRDWRALGFVGALTLVAGPAAGAIWLVLDRRTFAAGEYYAWAGWYFTFLTGAYLVGFAVVFVRLWKRGLARFRSAGKPGAHPEPTQVIPA